MNLAVRNALNDVSLEDLIDPTQLIAPTDSERAANHQVTEYQVKKTSGAVGTAWRHVIVTPRIVTPRKVTRGTPYGRYN